ncbi:hypothetical protein, partial [Salmonella enterica]|uniref:hypothetical protein n=1 Tax=Salmonella enterica TaxID=28901 RepID=UPI001CA40F05
LEMMFTTRFDVAFTATLNKMVHPGGLLALLAVADATLSFLVPAVITAILSVSSSLKVRRIWCIREDSNLRPLGS